MKIDNPIMGNRLTSVVTAGRTIGTVYRNTSSKNLFFLATLLLHLNDDIAFISDSSPAPTTVLGGITNPNVPNVYQPFFGIVLPKHYYKLLNNVGSTNLQEWVEWT